MPQPKSWAPLEHLSTATLKSRAVERAIPPEEARPAYGHRPSLPPLNV